MSESGTTARSSTRADRGSLEQQLRRAERTRTLTAVAMIAPLLLFLAVNFFAPVAVVLFKSVDGRVVSSVLSRTTRALSAWNGEQLPDAEAYDALIADLRAAREARTLGAVGRRLNIARFGYQALLSKTARGLPTSDAQAARETLVQIDERWGQTEYWAVVKRASAPITPIYLLTAFDLTIDANGEVARVPEYWRIMNIVWLRSIWMSLIITLLCVVMGYPLAYLMANTTTKVSNVILILILLPFWTAALVRAIAWVVLLQNEGILNDLGLMVGLWSDRIQLIHNRLGVYVAMSHFLLPFMVLPLFATMRRIPPHYVRAARSLGANPWVAFWKVYWPLTTHGVGAGAVFVVILALGFYITPALVGGRQDQMISYFIAFFANETLNWGAASALGTAFLIFTGTLYYFCNRMFGLGAMRMR